MINQIIVFTLLIKREGIEISNKFTYYIFLFYQTCNLNLLLSFVPTYSKYSFIIHSYNPQKLISYLQPTPPFTNWSHTLFTFKLQNSNPQIIRYYLFIIHFLSSISFILPYTMPKYFLRANTTIFSPLGILLF